MACCLFDRWRALVAFLMAAVAAPVTTASGQWTAQASGTTARLRGLSVVNREIVWASGSRGTFVRTTDGGTNWKAATVTGASDLDFRDVHAFDDRRALLLSIGEGEKSRIYRTTDGGNNWTIRFQNRDPRVFLDALAFWDADHGIALGDPVDGRFTILITEDGGVKWKPAPSEQMPDAKTNEGAFAASGTCLTVQGDRDVWFGTGGAGDARVFHSGDRGRTWTVYTTPILASDPSSGIFSLAFRNPDDGVAVGGDYKRAEQASKGAAITSDGGRTWSRTPGTPPAGYRSAVAFIPGQRLSTLVAVGPTGSDLSTDAGRTWSPLNQTGFHAVGFAQSAEGWAVGEDGLIARFTGAVKPRP
jgi:photosystem II stability/assembly factor-like uncharacterized protein